MARMTSSAAIADGVWRDCSAGEKSDFGVG
jgi:hypothetical protein